MRWGSQASCGGHCRPIGQVGSSMSMVGSPQISPAAVCRKVGGAGVEPSGQEGIGDIRDANGSLN